MALVISYLVMPLLAAALVVGMEPSSPPVPTSATSRPGCRNKCGEVEIPYPFGIGEECAWPGFAIICNQSFEPPRPYIDTDEIINISLEAGEARVFTIHSSNCYSSPNTTVSDEVYGMFDQAFLISPTRNVFTAIGCRAMAFLDGISLANHDIKSYSAGCFSFTSFNDSAGDGENCTGSGCCQSSIPGNLSFIKVSWPNETGFANPDWSYNPCSYAFVAQQDCRGLIGFVVIRYNFSRGDLIGKNFNSRVGNRSIPLVLDWAIRGNDSCQMTPEGTLTAPACVSANSTCLNVTRGGGYRCNCSKGYQGNPYLNGGCTVSSVSTFVLALLLCFLLKEHQRRVRRGFFHKNGGEILKRMNIKTFTKLELEKMTNHYSELIGKGHFGKVFNGIITDNNQQVAVKCPILDGTKKNQENNGGEFVDEIIFQFKISHANLVRLVGCCLETNVPCLVFEFIPNGTLYNVLHGAGKSCRLSLTKRLDIAIGSAEAISYMHSHGDHKHVHGDIKSANILLDSDLMPKVSDFGSSKLLSIDMYAKAVAADRNYVDPVYMKTDRFTAKSDVYSFGVVLLELITRKPAKYDKNKSLPIDFVKCCKEEGNGRKMYDTDILMNDGDAQSAQVYIECLDKIGELAVRCLKEVDIDERPTMEEVVEELKQVKSMATGGSLSETG
ncbi:hypothetical protein PR202_ga22760 [Eleusine coracana subsp. coracana]|uniref:Protein kinase domain-containing protein n=1 Tax=Eleusine coracana subsp. coracana TaxID=191504 RepID=A0AAV5D4S6_ELECO|nr:hypothetical protein PR202_ga22760 [Eleusine coracana subsp. coracana]